MTSEGVGIFAAITIGIPISYAIFCLLVANQYVPETEQYQRWMGNAGFSLLITIASCMLTIGMSLSVK